jgi:hypothetical protein
MAENPVIARLGEFKGLLPSENSRRSPPMAFQGIGPSVVVKVVKGMSTVNGALDASRPQLSAAYIFVLAPYHTDAESTMFVESPWKLTRNRS